MSRSFWGRNVKIYYYFCVYFHISRHISQKNMPYFVDSAAQRLKQGYENYIFCTSRACGDRDIATQWYTFRISHAKKACNAKTSVASIPYHGYLFFHIPCYGSKMLKLLNAHTFRCFKKGSRSHGISIIRIKKLTLCYTKIFTKA